MFDILMEHLWIVNILIIVFVLIGINRGKKKGLLLMLFECLSLGIALLLAITLLPLVANTWTIVTITDANIHETILATLTKYANYVAWFLILFAVGSLLTLLVRPLIGAISKIPLFKPINQFFGALFACIGAWIWLFVLSLLLYIPWIPQGSVIVSRTWLAPIQSNTIALFNHESVMQSFENATQLLTLFTAPNTLDTTQREQLRAWLLTLNIEASIIDHFLERSQPNNE